ncbi:hypothetical protein [Hymenobacter glacieicola]|uniref:Uncharacterized protein n=1 Tax=Hymenobacter glacieicola TaxID=1562124 RepID=A0ABQ1WG46_9BACT|nr:hypothetical protein [Hymenobacter glacieicola]GGG29237.1 hypothetical protein GCM10011378_02380 [Hymenobacter glacieicola]
MRLLFILLLLASLPTVAQITPYARIAAARNMPVNQAFGWFQDAEWIKSHIQSKPGWLVRSDTGTDERRVLIFEPSESGSPALLQAFTFEHGMLAQVSFSFAPDNPAGEQYTHDSRWEPVTGRLNEWIDVSRNAWLRKRYSGERVEYSIQYLPTEDAVPASE